MSSVLTWAALAWLTLLLFGWGVALRKALRTSAETPWKVGPEDAGPEGEARVVAVVPARNEVEDIETCVMDLLAQDHPGLTVTVLDDGSSDGTGEILARLAGAHPQRLRVLTGGEAPLPKGWLGKPWACHRAASLVLASAREGMEAPPDWFWFVDADVRLHPRAASASLGYAERAGVDLLSGLGTLELQTFWEKVVQPAVAGLVVGSWDMDRANDPEDDTVRPLANGQFILVRTPTWESVGGHAAVADDVLDDIGIASAAQAAGHVVQAVFMRRLFRCRMYTSLPELWEGWSKNLFAGMERSWKVAMGVVVGLSLFVLSPWLLGALALVGALPGMIGWVALVVCLQQLVMRAHLDRIFEQDLRYVPTMPLGFAVLVLLVLNSAIQTTRGTATWKGRVLAS